MKEIMEKAEAAEEKLSPEIREQLVENYMESMREAEEAGNADMAEYYKEKAKELREQKEKVNKGSLGGWYAGYTPAEWRRKAEAEYAKNGDSMKYRDYIKNAIKAED